LPTLAKFNKNAEQNFRDAFERLKLGIPEILPRGTRLSQNNVAKEAGKDTNDLRKARYQILVMVIQEYVDMHKDEESTSERQKLLKRKQKNRDAKELIADLKKQRDKAVDRIIYANLRILELSETVEDLRAKLEAFQPSATLLNFSQKRD